MNQNQNRPQAKPIYRKADIVFCIDSTGSMNPCFEGVKENLSKFIDGLQSEGNVDFRLKLIAYRDKHDPSCEVAWEYLDFTKSAETFKAKLSSLVADGGGGAEESTLDAIYEATQSKWRKANTHKVIVVFTDADTHPTLHPSTYPFPVNNDVKAVIQELQTLGSSIFFFVGPKFETYQKIEQAAQDAERKKIFYFLKPDKIRKSVIDDYRGLKGINFEYLMNFIGQSISKSIRS